MNRSRNVLNMNRGWLYILLGVAFEVCWVIGFKHAESFWTWFGTIVSLFISFAAAMRATFKLPVGTVYAVFTGLGTGCTVVAEMLLFGEPFKIIKVILIAVLLGGVLGLKMSGTPSKPKEVAQ